MVQINLSVSTITGGSSALTKSTVVMAINIVPIIPTKQIAVSNTQLCILLRRPFKAQENVYVSPNEEKSVTSTKCGKMLKVPRAGKNCCRWRARFQVLMVQRAGKCAKST